MAETYANHAAMHWAIDAASHLDDQGMGTYELLTPLVIARHAIMGVFRNIEVVHATVLTLDGADVIPRTRLPKETEFLTSIFARTLRASINPLKAKFGAAR